MIACETIGSVAVVRIDRADKMNALTLAMRERLRDLFAQLRDDTAVRSVLLCAAGERAFCTGADVAELNGNDTRHDFDQVTNPLVRNLHHIGKPVVCAVNGLAVGLGWSLALAADLVVCSEGARFSQIFRNVGLVPDGGATWFLSRAIGVNRARELVLSARFVSASEALALGLVQHVVEAGALHARSLALAQDLAQGPTLAFARAKQLFAGAMGPTLEEHLQREAELQCELTQSQDHKAALRAFAEKRKPEFVGH